ncbi:MAG TPA: hypothetical protein PKZ01_00425 [Candidatus Hydrogenedentes bacterium]|nr:hypothetical protein [Candidatus Hydrogenedentota bacterium]
MFFDSENGAEAFDMKTVLRWVEILVGATFVGAAALKALDMTSFAVQVSAYGIVRDPFWVELAAYGSVIAETLLGAAMVAGFRFRGLLYPATEAMLLGFSALILYAWRFQGLADCGCFGKYIELAPGPSILKNIVMMGLMAAVWRGWAKGFWRAASSAPRAMAARIAVAVICGVIVLGVGVYATATASPVPARSDRSHASSDRPFAQFVFERPERRVDLGEGQFLVAMLSASCEHCVASVAVLNDFGKMPGMPPVVALLMGSSSEIDAFLLQTAPEFPWLAIDALTFMTFIGSAPPRFFLVEDGRQRHFWDTEPPSPEDVAQVLAAEK